MYVQHNIHVDVVDKEGRGSQKSQYLYFKHSEIKPVPTLDIAAYA